MMITKQQLDNLKELRDTLPEVLDRHYYIGDNGCYCVIGFALSQCGEQENDLREMTSNFISKYPSKVSMIEDKFGLSYDEQAGLQRKNDTGYGSAEKRSEALKAELSRLISKKEAEFHAYHSATAQ